MKYIKYRIPAGREPGTEPVYYEKILDWSEGNEQIAGQEACDGVYVIEEDDAEEPAPTRLDILEAQVAYTAMMTYTLLEG